MDEYIFIISLLKDINIANIFHKYSQTYKNLIDMSHMVTLFGGRVSSLSIGFQCASIKIHDYTIIKSRSQNKRVPVTLSISSSLLRIDLHIHVI